MASLNDNTKSTTFSNTVSNNGSKLNIEKYSIGLHVAIGYHKVKIVKYLAEGGFAQIYVVEFIKLLNEFNDNAQNLHLKPGDLACLKRVMVQDERGLEEMRNEVEVMKLLSNKPNVVQYYDSNATRNHHSIGGFEVLLLMELCSNESLLTYLNQRLATKLTEQEILKIMYDISIGISHLHYLEPTLIHRDIKIENVLVDSENNFKLCDFGSTTKCPPVATTYQDISILGQDIYVHTTPQYRSPEMIDLFRYLPINEKSDIWALGVFLYKLLFYTTPFEHTGQFAILHAKYDIPRCKYSPQLINLIVIMLCENPYMRPNIYQVVYGICSILNVDVPIPDKYGIGPYDFDNFIRYQKKSENLQQQLFAQVSSVNVDNTLVNSCQINDVFLEYFDVMPRIQETKTSLEVPTQPSVARTKSITSDEKLSRHTTITIDSNRSVNSGATTTITSNGEHDTSETITNDKVFSNHEYSQSKNKLNIQIHNSNGKSNTYPNETHNFTKSSQNPFEKMEATSSTKSNTEVVTIPKRQTNSASHNSSRKYVPFINIDDTPIENTSPEVQEQRINYSKQHKSNNPFPKMVTERYSTKGILNNDENTSTNTTMTTANGFAKVSNNIFNTQQTTYKESNRLAHNAMTNFSQQASASLIPVNDIEPIHPPGFTEQQFSFSESANQGTAFGNKKRIVDDLSTNTAPTTATSTNNDDNNNINNNTNNSQHNKDTRTPQSKNSTNMPFPPPIVTQYSHKFEPSHITPSMNHQSPFFMDSDINTPIKSIPVAMQSLPLNRENNIKNTLNLFPHVQNVNINHKSPAINENRQQNRKNMKETLTNKTNIDVSLSETPSKLKTNTVSQTEKNLIDISPVARENSILSMSNNNQSHKNDVSFINDLKQTNKGSRPLQFSLDEINLSQESSSTSRVLDTQISVGKTESDNEDCSIASSESIYLNLADRDKKPIDNTKKGFENFKTDNYGSILRGKSMQPDAKNFNLLRMDKGGSTIDSKRHRHSLDLELQEINFSTQSLNLSFNDPIKKDEKNRSQIVVNSNPQNSKNNSAVIETSHNQANHSSKVHHQELSSVPTHRILNGETRTRNKNKIVHIRQSLDIERLRKDSLLGHSTGNIGSIPNGINSKRRSFFSLFKNDKN